MTLPILENALGFNLHRVAGLFRRELMAALKEYRMTPEQWQVMATLWRGTPLTQTEIVRLTLKDKPSVSRMIGRLQRNGWVTKAPNPRDERSTIISPTPEGWRLKDEVPGKLVRHFEPILSQLDGKETQTLLALLKQLRGVLGDEAEDTGGGT